MAAHNVESVDTPCGAECCPNCISTYVDCPDGRCQTCDNWYAELVGKPQQGRWVVWREGDVDENGNVRPLAISELVEIPSTDLMGYHGSHQLDVRRWRLSSPPFCGRCGWLDCECDEDRS